MGTYKLNVCTEARCVCDAKVGEMHKQQSFTFEEACAFKGLNPKAVLKRGRYRSIPRQGDRLSCNYPAAATVAQLLKAPQLPPEDEDQPSSAEATVAYIKLMYGHRSFMPYDPRIVNGQVVY